MGKKVLVTGGAGFAASYLSQALINRGYEVHGFVRYPEKLNGLVEKGVVPEVGDLTKPETVDRAMKGIDIVFHLAAAYRENLPMKELRAVNVDGTRHVMEAALKHKVQRVVHCSTVGVHGHVDNPPANETAPFKPYDNYQKTKTEGENVARSYFERGLPGVIYRPVGMYGPRDTRFLKLFKTIKKKTFVMFGNGETLYHLTYIDDIINGVVACGENPRALGQTYIIAGPKATTLNELVARIADALGVGRPKIRLPFGVLWTASIACETLCTPLGISPPLFRRRADWFRKDRSFDTTKIQSELGVKPQVSLDQGIAKTAAWYRSQGLI